ncbi:MAG: CRISPR-associated helicase Cas3' [Brevinematales bacterium]|nr:CRISPR-associated helicase Cas3' [Brevinematales bacterium]
MADNKNQILAKDNGISLKLHTKDILDTFNKLNNKTTQNDIKDCIELAITLHDLGKVLPYFQIVVLGNNNYEPCDVDKELNIYHSLASVLFINQEKLKEKLLNNDKNLKYVLSAIAYHHWKNSLEMDLRYGSEKFEKLLNYTSEQLVKNLQDELNELINGENDIIQLNKAMLQGLANGLSFADYVIPPYQLYWLPKRLEIDEEGKKKWILISGFLQRCDHYASFCEEDNSFIQKNDEEKNGILDNIEIEKLEYNQIVNKIKEEIKNKLTNKTEKTQDISLWQEEKLKDNNCKNNLILIAPTGSGKTEFAFLWSGEEKFFYTLPLRAAVEQIYDRATKIFGEDKTGLLHSDADVYLLGDDYNYERLKVYDVAKQLSYPVIVSTGDQFFPYGLRPPGYERIYATFSYSRVVIDEIQAYDPRATAIIVKFIEDIYRLGGKFLLMTATLPEYVKKEIEDRIKSNGEKHFDELNLYEEEKSEYQNLKKHKLSFVNISNKKKDKKIDFTIPEEIIKDIVSKAEDKKRVLVILSTVKQAKNIYERIKSYIEKNKTQNIIKDENIILFHSQFTLNEKQRIKNEIENKFKNPKDQNDNEGKILVATQVVEAAIDIDTDILYTEICPMDALVQRMGRVLRRYKKNFDLDKQNGTSKVSPNIYVLVFKEGYESGNGRVYESELIEKTLILLKDEGNDTNWQAYYDNLNTEKEKLKKKDDTIPDDNSEILMSEYCKYDLVKKLYEILNPNGKYLSKFYETLSLLDAGFMSDRREEAQRMFREIMNASVIDIAKKNDFIKKVKNLINRNDLNYTIFKKEIIAEFVISVPYWNLEKLQDGVVTQWIEQIEISDDNKKIVKLKEWCSDIFIVDLKDKNKTNKNDEDNII